MLTDPRPVAHHALRIPFPLATGHDIVIQHLPDSGWNISQSWEKPSTTKRSFLAVLARYRFGVKPNQPSKWRIKRMNRCGENQIDDGSIEICFRC